MTKSKLNQGFNWVEDHWPLVLVPLMLTTTLLWTFALATNFAWGNFISGLFYTLQFVVLNKEVDYRLLKDANPLLLYGLTFAQFAIPLTASVAFFGTLFREQIAPFLKGRIVNGLDGHQVIIGHGAMGTALLARLSKAEEKKKLVVLDLRANEHRDSAHVTHIQHNAMSLNLFELANLGKATSIYLLLPDERDNLAILVSLAKCTLRENVTVFVRAESNALRRLFADWVWLKNLLPNGKMDVRPINPYDIAARGIVVTYSPDIYAPTDNLGEIAQTIVVVGISSMAQALILRFARLGVYSPKGKLRLIWVGKGVTGTLARMAESYPALKPDNHPDSHWGRPAEQSKEFMDLVISPLAIITLENTADEAVRDKQVAAICGSQWPSAVYICHDSDVQNAIESRDLQAALCNHQPPGDPSSQKQRLILAVQNHSVVGIAQSSDSFSHDALPYGIQEVCIDTLFAETVANDRADDLAKKFDAVWSKRQEVMATEWNASPFFLKETNRDPADHTAIKLRFAGLSQEKVEAFVLKGYKSLDPEDINKLEKTREDLEYMEMRRYRAFMFIHGFSHGLASISQQQLTKKDAKDLDRCKRINETLLDEHLSMEQKNKDSDIVNTMIGALQMGEKMSAQQP